MRQLARVTFTETKSKLVEAGMIPPELVETGNLQDYVSSLDSVLEAVIKRRASDLNGLQWVLETSFLHAPGIVPDQQS